MRITHLIAFLLAAARCVDVSSQTIPPPNDLMLSGRVIGPLPLQYGRPSEFELVFTNLGPTNGPIVRAYGRFPYSPPVIMYAVPGSPCGVEQCVTCDPPDPVLQDIEIAALSPAVGTSVVCRFRIVPVSPQSYPPGRSLNLFGSWDYWPFVDPDLSNNGMTFGLDPPSATSVPALSGWLAAGLALLVGLVGLVGLRRERCTWRGAYAVLLAALVMAAATPLVQAQSNAPRTDLALQGRALGPLPVQPGRLSEFELTVTNLGPLESSPNTIITSNVPTQPFIWISSSPGECTVGYLNDGDPPPQDYLLFILPGAVPAGGTRTCRFALRPEQPLPLDMTMDFTVWGAMLIAAADVDFSNNTYTFGVGPASPVSVPAIGALGLMILGIAMVVALRLGRSARAT